MNPITNQATHLNPLDKNHDGKVNLQDLHANNMNNQGLNNQGVHQNPLDRNHDGKVNLQDLHANNMNNQGQVHGLGMNQGLGQMGMAQQSVIGQQTTYVQSNQRASIGLVRAEPTVLETIQKDVVIHERIHPVQKEEIQPIIYREREQLDVKQVTQMMHETQIQPTIVQQRELPAQTREAVIERGAPIAENYVAASREVDATLRTQVVHAPIVNEVIKKTIIEEIQPVLERDIITSTVIQNTQPIYEKIVEAPNVYRSTVTVVQDRGIVGGDLAALEAQGFNLGETGRRLSQGFSSTTIQQSLAQQQMHANQGYAQQGLNQGAHHNPLDRNHDGRVNLQDLHANNQQGLNSADSLLTNRGVQGVNSTGLPLNNQQGLNHGLNQQGLNNQGLNNQGVHQNPLDRNHDGKVNLQDLSGRQTGTQANRPVNLL